MPYKIRFEANPSDEDLQILGDGIDRFSRSKVGRGEKIHLTFFLHDDEGVIIGGVYGNYTSYGWLYISALWVSGHVRASGYGTKLMNCIEQKAIEAGCTAVYL